MRVVLVALAALGAALVGRSMASSCVRRARVLRQAMDALQVLRLQMLERRLPLHAALSASRFEALRLAGERMAAGADAKTAWEQTWRTLSRRGGALDCLAREDAEALSTLFGALGTGTRLEQEALFASALRELGRLESEAARFGAEKGRLYTTLGLLCGLMLAIAFV